MDIANFAVAFVAMLAALTAAYFAFKGPTHDDVRRVEQHTADTSAELSAVRQHIAQVEEHLASQTRRQELAELGQSVSLRVEGEGWSDEELQIAFKVLTPSVVLKKIELLGRHSLLSGSLDCAEREPGSFTATVGTNQMAKWIESGEFLGHTERHTADINAILELAGQRMNRTFPVVIVSTLRPRPAMMLYYYSITGDC